MALMYMFFFFMRRLLLAILAVWSSESTMFQIFTMMTLSFANCIYLLKYKPFGKGNLQNRLELINEGFILVIHYIFMSLTDFFLNLSYIDDSQINEVEERLSSIKVNLGRFLIIMTCLLLAFNILIMTGIDFEKLRKLIHEQYLKIRTSLWGKGSESSQVKIKLCFQLLIEIERKLQHCIE